MNEDKTSGSRNRSTPAKVGPAVIWAIPKNDYFIESKADGRPLFHHTDFTYQAVAAGTGAILWYIECTENRAYRPCPVRGVRHKDGRLLMLRAHNHFIKSSKLKRQTRKVSPPAKATAKSTSSIRAIRDSAPFSPDHASMPATIQERWLTLTQKNLTEKIPDTTEAPKAFSEVSISDSDLEVSLNDCVQIPLQTSLQDKWRSARRKSFVTRLRSAVLE